MADYVLSKVINIHESQTLNFRLSHVFLVRLLADYLIFDNPSFHNIIKEYLWGKIIFLEKSY